MEPFSRPNKHNGLTSALNDTFEMFHWLNEHALNDRPAGEQATINANHNPTGIAPASTIADQNCSNSSAGKQTANQVINEEHLQLASPLGFDINAARHAQVSFQKRKSPSSSTNNSSNTNNNNAASGHQNQQLATADAIIMDKRQLIDALTSTFLGKLKSSLVERVQEFTDCAYTKHENRETILQLVQCIKLQLNKLVKLLYRLRRRPANANELNLTLIQHLATQFDETCLELKLELQNVVIDQSDELDRANLSLNIIKELKQQTLMGDLVKTGKVCKLFQEQNERLIELCKMLNQVASSNKMKMSTKSLAIWFELNTQQLLASADCLSREPRSKVLKDHLWAYIQVWCSFYDDFCQLARQTAYLVHRQFDSERSQRISQLRHQIRLSRNQQSFLRLANFSPQFGLTGTDQSSCSSVASTRTSSLLVRQGRRLGATLSLSQPIESTPVGCLRLYAQASDSHNYNANANNSNLVSNLKGASDSNNSITGFESPRSLDHYYGFGTNYHQILGRQNVQQAPVSSLQDKWLEEQQTANTICNGPMEQIQGGSFNLEAANCNQIPIWQQAATSKSNSNNTTSGHLFANNNNNNNSAICPQIRSQQTVHHVPSGGNFQQQASSQYQVPSKLPVAPPVPARASVKIDSAAPPLVMNQQAEPCNERQDLLLASDRSGRLAKRRGPQLVSGPKETVQECAPTALTQKPAPTSTPTATSTIPEMDEPDWQGARLLANAPEPDGSGDPEADAIVRGAKETAQMALSMYQFIRGEGELNTTQDLFTQAELFAEEANELYKEVRCFSYKVPSGDLKRDLLTQLSSIPALVQQLQFVVKSPTVGNAATFAKVDAIIRETRSLMEAVNRVVNATMSCRQQYNMAVASRKRTRTLSPAYRSERGSLDFDGFSSRQSGGMGARQVGGGGAGMGSEPDI